MLPETWKKEIGNSIEEAAQRQTKEQERNINEHNTAIATPLNALCDHFETYVEQQARAESGKSRREIATIIGLFLTAGLALGQGIILILQWRALSSTDVATHDLALAAVDQAKAAKDAAEGIKGQLSIMQGQLEEMKSQRLVTIAQLRANLRREQPIVNPIGEGGKLIVTGEKLLGWEISPVWINAGSTSAQDFRGWFEIRTVDFAVGKKIGPSDCPMPTIPEDYSPFGGTIIAQGGTFLQLSKRLSIEDATKAMNNPMAIFMMGHIEYKDAFPDTQMHRDDWCVSIIPADIPRSRFTFLTIRDRAD